MVNKEEWAVLVESSDRDAFLIAAYNHHRRIMIEAEQENNLLRLNLTMRGITPDAYLALFRREQQEGCLTGNSGTTDRVG